MDLDSDAHLYLLSLLAFQSGFILSMIISVMLIILLLVLSALISGSEVAFFSFTPSQKKEIKEKDSLTSRYILRLLNRPKRLLATILIANNFINVSIVIVTFYFIHDIFSLEGLPQWLIFLIEVVIITAMILLLGEIMPKILAANRSVRFAELMARPIFILLKILYPLSHIMVKSTNFIDKRIAHKKDNISMEELSDALEITSGEDTPDEELKMLEGIIKFGDIEVKEIMKSRVDVVAIDNVIPFRNLLKTVVDSGYSRIPVFEESFDNVKGILYVKDLLPFLNKTDSFDWKDLVKPAFFVPESKKINDLLQEIRDKKIHLAIVVDEYGGTAGIVTLEDIIEEIIGEISDEFDPIEAKIKFKKLNEKTYYFEGKTSLNDFCKIINVEDDYFGDIKGDFDSLAGLLLEHFGGLPERDDSFEYNNFHFKVVSVDHKRIREVKVVIKD